MAVKAFSSRLPRSFTCFATIGERVGRRRLAAIRNVRVPGLPHAARADATINSGRRGFEYRRCPQGHGRLTSFFNFLREKDFVRPLSAAQLAELRKNVQSVNCSNCGRPSTWCNGSACGHCGSPLSMLDLGQAGALVTKLREASTPGAGPSIRRCHWRSAARAAT
jgi:hypothetical protein